MRLLRALVILAAFSQVIISFLPSLFNVGVDIGSRVTSSSLIIPMGYAFSIWGVIFSLTICFSVYQFFQDNTILRELRPVSFCIFCLSSIWMIVAQLMSAQVQYITVFIIILSLIACLKSLTIVSKVSKPSASFFTFVILPFTLYSGWITLATFANISDVLHDYGIAPFGQNSMMDALLLIIAGTLGVIISILYPSISYPLPIIWGLLAIIVARFVSQYDLVIILIATVEAAVLAFCSLKAAFKM